MMYQTLLGAFLAAALATALPATAMDKAGLVDAIASGAKLTKADAGRALDATIESISTSLKRGDRVALVGFGTFSVSKREAQLGPDGTCAAGLVDAWEAAPTLARRLNPSAYKADLLMRVRSASNLPGQTSQTATVTIVTGTVFGGTKVDYGLDDGNNSSTKSQIVVDAIFVNGVAVSAASNGVATLKYHFEPRNSETGPIIRGTALRAAAYPPELDPPLSPCESYATDSDVASDVALATGLTPFYAGAAVQAMKSSIVNALTRGEMVHDEILGDFYVEATILLSAPEPGSDLSKIKTGVQFKKSFGQLAGKK